VEVELDPGLADGFHAAFKDGVFDGVGIIGNDFKKPEGDGNNYHEKSEKNSRDEKQSYIAIVREQSSASQRKCIVVVYHTRFWQGKLFSEMALWLTAED
jgi:hypothetical protein